MALFGHVTGGGGYKGTVECVLTVAPSTDAVRHSTALPHTIASSGSVVGTVAGSTTTSGIMKTPLPDLRL